jgi:hypothetical protein
MRQALPDKLHFLAKSVEGNWVVSCLDFDLAAQGHSFEDAREGVMYQVEDYIQDAFELDNGEHASLLLSRRSPAHKWLIYHAVSFVQKCSSVLHGLRSFATDPPSFNNSISAYHQHA